MSAADPYRSLPLLSADQARSSVTITENAKGEPAVRVKAYTHDLDGLDQAREAAVRAYRETVAAVRA